MCQQEFENQIRKDINFLLRDYPMKKLSRQDFNKILGMERARISCMSHKQLETIKGLYEYCHNERKKLREELNNFLNSHIEGVLKSKKIVVVGESYKEIKKQVEKKDVKTKVRR